MDSEAVSHIGAWLCVFMFGVASEALAAPQLTTGDGLEPLPADTRPLHYRIVATPDGVAGRFDAIAELEFEVLQPTSRVTVNALELDVSSARLAGGDTAKIVEDVARQRVIFELAQPLARGKHKIAVVYSGRINDTVGGVFRINYPTRGGTTRQMLFTHLCCIGTARRFAPMWDQPDLKAVFEIELVVPKGLDAVSNMPIAHREEIAGERARVRFAPTPKMSSYLLFFAVGEFDRIARRAGSTELAVVLQRGKAEQGRFALDATADAIEAYNDYFGTPYPLPKLDSVGMPGAGSFGAMENWGAIFYFEPYIAMDPELSTERDRQVVYEIVAHEVAHQWFGNLVTMRWWDDLWLNEGFASWMASKTSDRFHPEWKMWLHAANNRESAIRLDAVATTHPIIREVKTLEEAELAFDDITYEKGNQVIRMIEGWVGADAFRTAIRAYVRKHAYDNAVTADLLREVDKISEFPVAAVARDFTQQEGVPMIEVLSTKCARDSKVTTVMLRQGRFGLDEPSKRPLLWHVPVTAAVAGSNDVARKVVRGTEPARIDVPGCGPVKINVAETGYYRTLYDPASLAGLQSAFASLSVTDQFGLLKDSRSLAEGEYVSFAMYFDIADNLPADADPLLIHDYVQTVRDLDRLYAGLPSQAAFRAFVRSRFAAVLARVGWTAKPAEPPNTALLRDSLIRLLASVGDEATLAEAARRFKGADQDSTLLPGAIRKAVVAAVGAGADTSTFTDLAARAARATDSAEKRLYLLALAGGNDPAIARRAMELSFSDAVPPQLFPALFQTLAERHPEPAFDFAAQRYELVESKTGSHAPMYMASLARNAVDAAFIERFSAFVAGRLGNEAKESSERAKSAILHSDRLRRTGLVQVDAWLARRERGE